MRHFIYNHKHREVAVIIQSKVLEVVPSLFQSFAQQFNKNEILINKKKIYLFKNKVKVRKSLKYGRKHFNETLQRGHGWWDFFTVMLKNPYF